MINTIKLTSFPNPDSPFLHYPWKDVEQNELPMNNCDLDKVSMVLCYEREHTGSPYDFYRVTQTILSEAKKLIEETGLSLCKFRSHISTPYKLKAQYGDQYSLVNQKLVMILQ